MEVFISYSSKDKLIADAVCHALEENLITCWIAPRDLEVGLPYPRQIMQAIKDCNVMVLVFSENANRSEHVGNEIDHGFNNGKTIIPFLIDNTEMNDDLDYYLSRTHWLVAYPDYRKKTADLVSSILRLLGKDHPKSSQNIFHQDKLNNEDDVDSNTLPNQVEPSGLSLTNMHVYVHEGGKFECQNIPLRNIHVNYNPEEDDIIVMGNLDNINDFKTVITYNPDLAYDLVNPHISSPFISNKEIWKAIYEKELLDTKLNIPISYPYSIGYEIFSKTFKIGVSTCSVLASSTNRKYFEVYPNDWQVVKQVLKEGDLDKFYRSPMPGRISLNITIINGNSNQFLARRFNRIIRIGLSEGMENISDHSLFGSAPNIQTLIYRSIYEDLGLEANYVKQIVIGSLSITKELEIMITAFAKLDITKKEEAYMSKLSDEHSNETKFASEWLPIKIKEIKEYIEDESGFYSKVMLSDGVKKTKWVSTTKFQMYEFWRNIDRLGLNIK